MMHQRSDQCVCVCLDLFVEFIYNFKEKRKEDVYDMKHTQSDQINTLCINTHTHTHTHTHQGYSILM